MTDSLAVNHRIYIQFVGLDLSQAAASRPTEYEALIGQGDRSTRSAAKMAGACGHICARKQIQPSGEMFRVITTDVASVLNGCLVYPQLQI